MEEALVLSFDILLMMMMILHKGDDDDDDDDGDGDDDKGIITAYIRCYRVSLCLPYCTSPRWDPVVW